MIHRMSRRSALLALTAGCGGLVSGCVAPPEPPPAPPAEPPPLPVLASLAAQVGVEVADPGTRQVVLRTASGGQMNVTLAAGIAMPRAGSRVLFQYDDRGAARLLPVPRRPGAVPPGMIAATIREVERGGRHMALVDPAGIEAAFALPHPAMMAFATRLAPGEAIAVTVAGP